MTKIRAIFAAAPRTIPSHAPAPARPASKSRGFDSQLTQDRTDKGTEDETGQTEEQADHGADNGAQDGASTGTSFLHTVGSS